MAPRMERQPEPEAMDRDDEARAYAVADFVDVNQAFVDRLLELAARSEEACALDLGTGPADIPIRVVRRRPDWRVTGVDVSEAMVAIARKRVVEAGLTESVDLVCCDVKELPLPSSSVDMVLSNSLLHHISDADAFWTEVQRVALPGAVLLVRDLSRPDSEEAARAIVATYAGSEPRLLQEEYYRSLLSAYTPDEVRQQIVAAGLDTLQIEMVSDRHLDVYGRLP